MNNLRLVPSKILIIFYELGLHCDLMTRLIFNLWTIFNNDNIEILNKPYKKLPEEFDTYHLGKILPNLIKLY